HRAAVVLGRGRPSAREVGRGPRSRAHRRRPLMSELTESKEWQALVRHQQAMRARHLPELFTRDPQRAAGFTVEAGEVFVDYSKNRITDETLGLLLALARRQGVERERDRMFAGDAVNGTEGRAVLHVALRNLSDRPMRVAGDDV